MDEHLERLTRVIDALPDDGAVIVVFGRGDGHLLKGRILERRGEAFARRCRMLCMQRMSDAYRLEGRRCQVVLDQSFRERAKPRVIEAVERLAQGCRIAVGAKPIVLD